MDKNNNYIIFSSIDWNIHWQLHHQLATSFASSGNKVLYVDNTGVRSPAIGDFSRLKDRFINWLRSVHGFDRINENLTVYSPLLLPFPYSKLSLVLNKYIFKRNLLRWMDLANFYNPIVITFLPTPLIQSLAKELHPSLTIYYCANNMSDSSNSAKSLKPYEDYFFSQVDLVFSAGYTIEKHAKKFTNLVYNYPPGIDFDKFSEALNDNCELPSDINKLPRPIIGYVGTLGRVFDQELLCKLADSNTNCSIVLIGPKYTDLKKLEEKSNIYFLGKRPHAQIPFYIKSFDVAIVPYVCTKFTEGVYPSKLNEYLAMGVSTVTTNINETQRYWQDYGDVFTVADSHKEFIEAVRTAINRKDNQTLIDNRIAVAKANSWEYRFNGISEKINNALESNSSKKYNWKSKLESLFLKKYLILRNAMLTVVLTYLLIFYTPIVWYASKPLISFSPPQKADVIVVFGGYGESGYANFSFQQRVNDALKLFKSGYAQKILVSSGVEHKIKESNLMRALLKDKGVPDSSIILSDGASNTYESVIQSSEMLKNNGWNSVLLITSKYHSQRAKMTWDKQRPKINVTSIVLDSISEAPQWRTTIDQIKVILYEYAALIHNWLFNRI